MKAFFLILSLLGFIKSQAQQQHVITQYMLNGFVLNPAYAGSYESWSFALMSRYQWVGIEGAPRIQTISAHGPIKDNSNSSTGLSVSNDKFGAIEITNVYGAYSYRIPFNQNKSQLSLGFKVGVSNLNVDLSQNNLINPDDPVFNTTHTDSYLPNFGLGVYYQQKNLYAGFSIPYFHNNRLNQIESNLSKQSKHYYLTLGGIVVLNQSVKYKPSMLVRYVNGTALDIDLNSSFVFNDVVWLGVTYRFNNTFNFILELQVTDNFRIGYGYDLISSELNTVSSGSHEFVLNYRIKRRNKVFHPRYF